MKFKNEAERAKYYREITRKRLELAQEFFTIEAYLNQSGVNIWEVLNKAVKSAKSADKRKQRKQILNVVKGNDK